jgi:hypothetical protein
MAEHELYEPVQNFVNLRFAPSVHPKYGFQYSIVEVTAKAGIYGEGQWTRPDLSLVTLWRNKYAPTLHLDLYGFEVKALGSASLLAVHEALAQGRLLHYSYLALHVDKENPLNSKIRESCRSHGVGLITFSNPRNPDCYNILESAQRGRPSLNAIDEFIESRFAESTRRKIEQLIRTGAYFDEESSSS